MFFGLEVKSNQNQAKPIVLENTVRLSQACLEPNKNGKKEPVCLVAEYEKKQFILCVLDPSQSWQSPLDLMFEAGSEVKFFVRGSGTIHVTGYESFDDLDDISVSMSSDDEEIVSSGSELDEPKKLKALTNGKSTKVNEIPVKRKQAKRDAKIPVKKSKTEVEEEEEVEDESEDEDFQVLDAANDDDDDIEDSDDDEDDDDEVDNEEFDEEMFDESFDEADDDSDEE